MNPMKTLLAIANTLLVAGILALAFQTASPDARSREEVDAEPSREFIRGDANDDSAVDLSDAVSALGTLFLGNDEPACLAAADSNDDGGFDIGDPIYLLNFLFRGGGAPPAPFPTPGEDPTPDLPCRDPVLAPLPPVGSYGGPDRELSEVESLQWRRGFEVFDRAFRVLDGLGPLFNGDSCRGCHLDPVVGGSGGLDVDVVRFAYADGQGVVSQLETGPAASRHELPGFTHDEVHPDANIIETRQTPTLLGLGLIDRLPESVILANADPNDDNADGVSGSARFASDGRLGRFGHKAGVPSLTDFTADAMLNELGITIDPVHSPFAGAADADAVADPELSGGDFDDLAFFVSHLAPPPRAFPGDPVFAERTRKGAATFERIGCAKCHLPVLDGPDGPIAAYSDFLLHDVGDPARRQVNEDGVGPREFRTAPLWGLRDTGPYLHDGSARLVSDAILFGHFGEGATAKAAFQALSFDDRSQLTEFLLSL